MAILQFSGYGYNSTIQYVLASRIVNFKQIDYNGHHGTEIFLDNDTSIKTGDWPSAVVEKISNLENNGENYKP